MIEKIEDLNVGVTRDSGHFGTNKIRIYNGSKSLANLWITNTGELDSPNEELSMELRALYYAIEHIATLEKIIKELRP